MIKNIKNHVEHGLKSLNNRISCRAEKNYYYCYVQMKKVLSILFVIILFSNAANSQGKNNEDLIESVLSKKNNVQLEFLGKGLYYSINYERELFDLSSFSVQYSTGFCVFPSNTSLEPTNELILPHQINIAYHDGSHHFHFGFGTSFWRYQTNYLPIDQSNLNLQPIAPILEKQWEIFSHLSLEYRYYKETQDWFYKVGYTPLFFAPIPNSAFNKSINYQTSFTLGIGYKF